MRRALTSLVLGVALTIGTHGATFAAAPASPATDVRQSSVEIDPSTNLPTDTGDLSNGPVKTEPDSDTNSGPGD